MICRRDFLMALLGTAAGGMLPGSWAASASGASRFFFAQLHYESNAWDPYPLFGEALGEEIELRTSIEVSRERRIVTLSDSALFFCPFLYMAGREEFAPFSDGSGNG